ncbi:MAG: IS30 family transposase [Acetobacteraceae bacterium]
MGTQYRQLCDAERKAIDRLHAAGRSVRQIAFVLVRAPSTISRELRRNSRPSRHWPAGQYLAERASELTRRRRRRGRGHKLARQPALRRLVRDRLAMGWSPEQISGRLARQHGRTIISHESIYRFVYFRTAQKDYWNRLLPRRKHRRGRPGRRGASSVHFIKNRVHIGKRSKRANSRRQAGHWEADLMLFRKYGQAVLVVHERRSRLIRIRRQPSKAARPVLGSLARLLRRLPRALRRSITFDNGSEFAFHYRLATRYRMQTFFCDPHAPWQKGGIENAIGRLRRPLPRKSDLAVIPQEHLDAITHRYNRTPRKCLGFRTPEDVFRRLKHRVALQP